MPADRVRRRLQALGEVDVVHRLAGAVDVAVAQEVAQAQLERVEPSRSASRSIGALARPGGLHLAVAAERPRGRQVRVDAVRSTRTFGIRYGPGAAKPIFCATPGPQSA